ncbi:chromosome segregation protein [Bacillus sp. Xin]|uniref:chromosome segregation protein n=1 Tax=unclassified Bacillus (in: firmicutes) TaxID=185979 RepID=UPI001573349A|nr:MULTISPECIES: chromosome segregation protein [unclassified Bacillus (in: firmicutes)]MBC6972937.1 chromosome segregation protein [Bacillus sp. Xin]NSW36518.1 chromosome segregation protein [Bacillus sp. Xin1]
MEYKTPVIAKKLGVSPKAVVRIAQQLNLNIEKNKYGHFIFTQEDLDKMLEYHRTQIEQTSPLATESSIDFEKFVTQLNTITHRLNHIEEKMQDKADDVVNYQLLQHRREMEEMMNKIQQLEAALEKEEPLYITPDIKTDIAPTYERKEKPKRRKMILSIFGF